ncbi:MAG: hypothetical protein E6J90_09740 [Deltaproteobacteria bacterium]|nr:MAG: hypothetical protein E6J91_22110 [Deltaproteobacteria bacterium]TMQ23759.1 MAG: hypothetical protein E6J90_09740 [Deltaproteobacteria bacterium]
MKQLKRLPPAIRWAMPAPGERLFSASAQRIQIIIAPSRKKNEQCGWVFSDGKFDRAYRFPNNDANQLVAHINEQQKLRGFSYGVLYHSMPKLLGRSPRSSTQPPSSELALPDDPDDCGGSTTGGTTESGGQTGDPATIQAEANHLNTSDQNLSTPFSR